MQAELSPHLLESKPLCVFDENCAFFVFVTHDHRIQLWDSSSELKQEHVQDKHLTKFYTAIAISQQSSTKKVKRKGTNEITSIGLVALGSRSGAISILNLSTGTFTDCSAAHTNAITSIVFVGEDSFYSSSVDCSVQQFILSQAEWKHTASYSSHHAISLISILSKQQLLISESLTLEALDVSLSPWALSRRFAGMTSPILCIETSFDSKFILTLSEAHICIWDANPAANGKLSTHNRSVAIHTISLVGRASYAQWHKSSSDPYIIAVLLDNSYVSLCTFSIDSTNTDSFKVHSTVSNSVTLPKGIDTPIDSVANNRTIRTLTQSLREQVLVDRANRTNRRQKRTRLSRLMTNTLVDAKKRDQILYFCWRGKQELLIARYHGFQIIIESLEVIKDDRTVIQGLILKEHSGNALIDSSTGTNSKKKRSEKVLVPSASDYHPSTISAAATQNNMENSSLVHASLAERVAALEAQSGTYAGDIRVLSNGSRNTNIPRIGTVQTLLTQALHTNDDALFEYCLSQSLSALSSSSVDRSAVDSLSATVARLPSAFIIPLLSRLIETLNARPSRAFGLITWIKCVITTHISYLLSLSPNTLNNALSTLYALIDSRLASAKKMNKLKGRLEVLMAQMNSSQNWEKSENIKETPLLVWREEDEEILRNHEEEEDDDDDEDEEMLEKPVKNKRKKTKQKSKDDDYEPETEMNGANEYSDSDSDN